MPDEKKANDNKNSEKKELEVSDLKKASGGTLKDVNYTETHDISDDTKSKI